MRAFLTGATGTVGREVYRELQSRGVEVRIAARESSVVADVLPGASDVVTFDFETPSLSPRSFEDIDALFLMTPLIENQVAGSDQLPPKRASRRSSAYPPERPAGTNVRSSVPGTAKSMTP